MWQRTWGSKVDFLKKRAKKTGVLPPALATRPTVTPDVDLYYVGWKLLDARRLFNESGAQATPLSDVIAAAKLTVGDDDEEIMEFCRVITETEVMVLKELAEKRKRDIEKASRKTGKR